MSSYQPSQFESKLIATWEKDGVYKTGTDLTEKQYILNMFPYPSGAGLHTGHARIYIATDVIARYTRMNGKSVLFPMGWDAFGLPAENAAIKQQRNPSDMTQEYIGNFKSQIIRLGLSYDWDKEIDTTDPQYYAITQWLFIQFFKAGLLYKKDTNVDFCEYCKTGLAQEEVESDGTHERCGNLVTKKTLPQWMFRITKYADRLLTELEGLDWPKGIVEMQKNWIGKKIGMIIHHKIDGVEDYILDTFTAYPAWSYADTFIVIAPEHPFVESILKGNFKPIKELDINTLGEYVKKSQSKSNVDRMVNDKNKTGVFTGYYAVDPFRPNIKMPIWVADFALMDFGTGAIRCSAHDVRDLEFANRYSLPLREVVASVNGKPVNAHDNKGILIDSGEFTGRLVDEVVEEFCNWLEEKKIGVRKTNYHLRDWIFSRQHYWGEPIPMVFCQKCADKKISYKNSKKANFIYPNTPKMDHKISENWDEIDQNLYGWFPMTDENLPLELPYLEKYEPSGTGESPLSKVTDWVKATCPECGGEARRETDTMPNWAGSSWYFLAYAMKRVPSSKYQVVGDVEKNNQKNGFNLDTWNLSLDTDSKAWLPVDWYIGGAEHAVLHLLYARFWVKILQDLGYIDFNEPFLRLRSVGIVIAEDNRKMSKSYGNVINPDQIIKEYGCDALRIYEMFMAPFSQEVAWSTNSLQGSYRFIKRIWQIFNNNAKLTTDSQNCDKNIVAELQKTIQKVGSDITDVKFNTAIATMMKFLNSWESGGALEKSQAKKFLQVLAPFAPFVADQLWREIFGETKSIHSSVWPVAEMSLVTKTNIKIAIQVDGKVRDVLEVDPELVEDQVVKLALESEKVKKFLSANYGTRFVKGRVLNFINKG